MLLLGTWSLLTQLRGQRATEGGLRFTLRPSRYQVLPTSLAEQALIILHFSLARERGLLLALVFPLGPCPSTRDERRISG